MLLRSMKYICLFTTLLLFGCSLSHINLKEGIIDFKKLHYRDAFVRLKPEAQRGHPEAQYAVGFMYYYGFGVNEDRKLALYWIGKAAERGYPLAIEALKRMDKEYCGHFCVRQGPAQGGFQDIQSLTE